MLFAVSVAPLGLSSIHAMGQNLPSLIQALTLKPCDVNMPLANECWCQDANVSRKAPVHEYSSLLTLILISYFQYNVCTWLNRKAIWSTPALLLNVSLIGRPSLSWREWHYSVCILDFEFFYIVPQNYRTNCGIRNNPRKGLSTILTFPLE